MLDLQSRRLISALRFGGLALIGFGLVEVAFLGVRSLFPMAARVAWAATALAISQGLVSATGRSRTLLLSILAGTSPMFFAALLWERGGATGVPFAFLLATPLVIAVLLQGEVAAAVVASVTTLGTGIAMLVQAQVAASTVREWTMAILGGAVMAVFTAVQHKRMMAATEAATLARLAAQERLAESEVKRAQAERGTLVGYLAGGLAHEVNNPLSFMTANLAFLQEALREKAALGAELDELSGLVRETADGARRIANVMAKLKAFGFEATDLGPCSLTEAVRTALSGLGVPPGVEVHNEVPGGLPAVVAAPSQLGRALSLIVISALESFDGRAGSKGSVWLRAHAQPGSVLLSIEDDGPLVWSASPGAEATGVGDRFRGKSSSVGLSLVQESLGQWGGSLAMGPRAGGGTRVELTFAQPRATA